MTIICLLSNDYYVKCVRDILFVGLSIGFVIYTLNPHRTGIDKVAPATAKRRRLSDRRAAELEADIDELIVAKRLYTDPNLTIDRIAAELSSNANYVSEAIGYGNYGSFYNMINSIRVEQAARILQADKTTKLESVAYDCGFSSASVFSRIFKRIKGVSPSEFLKS